MKKFILFVTFTLITFAGFSQTKGISYQAVIIDPNPIELPGQDIVSQPYVSKDVWIKFGIYSGSTLQYEELQKTKTDEYGLVNLIIGSGINTGQAGTFTSLSWDGLTKNIVTSVSFDQGAHYTQVSNQRLNYVPYSYFAESAGKLSGVLSINQGGTGATNPISARANIGLGNVDNTADADKPVSKATLSILEVKESLTNKSENIIADSASLVKYPSVKAIKNYVDSRTSNNSKLAAKATALEIARKINGVSFDGTTDITIPVGVTPADADSITKGILQLAGDLSGTAISPSIAAGAVGTAKLADGSVTSGKLADASVTNAKIVSVAGSKVTGDIAGNAATATLATTATSAEKATKLTTSRTINGVAFDGTADITIPVGVTPVDADATTKGILQLAGDLSGTAASPSIVAGAVGTAKLADGSVTSGKLADASVTNAKIVSVAGSKVTGDIAGNAATATLAADATKLATPRNINGIPFDGTADITISASSSTLSGTISIANGGTGATTAAGARTNLGLAIGTDVQAPLSFTAPLVQNGNGVSISQATPSVAGFLSSVDYTSFSNKIDATEKGANNGVATLGNNGKIPSVQIPAISFQNVNVVNSDASMIAISGAQVGSIAIRTDNNQNFVLSALPASTLSNWIALATPLYVSSVNGYAGPNVSLTTNDVGEGSTNKYFTDARARNSISAIAPLNYNATTGVISMTTASTNSSGFLTASDFTTFNNKQTALTAGVDYLSPTGSAASLTNFPTLNQNTTGNAATATKFATSRTINGVAFDGSTNITVAADANTLTGTSLASNVVNSSLTTLGTITSGVWSGTTIDIAKGGTGAITAAAARTNLGLAIGTDVLAPNASITAATKTKITYDAKGLVTAGVDATTADIAPSTNRNYVTDAQAGVLSNTSGVNTGDQTISLTGDVSGTGTGSFATTVNSVGGVGSSTISGFDTRITSNTSSITTLNTNVAANTASITSNTADIALKAPIASPNLTGTPTAPTATAGTNTTQLATTAFVNAAVSNYTPTTSLSLAGGLAGNIPYQTAPGTTGFIPNGAANQFLTSTGSGTYTWTSASNVTGNFVPYTGATGAVNLGAYDLTVNGLTVGKGGGAKSDNTVLGVNALLVNTTGNYSTAVGTNALKNSTNGANTAFGNTSLYQLTTGISNTALGYHTLSSATTQNSNTAVGDQSMRKNTGSFNTALGTYSLYGNTSGTMATGDFNTGIGYLTLQNATTAANNAALGSKALSNLTSGNDNTVIGYNSGALSGTATGTALTSANQSILIGSGVRAGTNTTTNEIVIGYQAVGNGSNTVTVGNLSNTATYFTGDINLTGNIKGGTWSGTVIGSNYGGAGSTNGLLKANGAGVVSSAISGTDYLVPNAAITAATKTKITYDIKGLVTAGADATTADIAPSTNRNYVTDAQAGVLSNTSGVNTGDQTITLTGDVTGSGTGSFATTLTDSGVSSGTYGSTTTIPVLTVDSKGRLTAANSVGILAGVNSLNYTSTTSYAAGGTISGTTLTLAAATSTNPGLISTGTQTIGGAKIFSNDVTAPNFIGTTNAGTLTGTTLASTVVNSSLSSVGTITSGVWSGTAIAIAKGGTGSTTRNFVDLSSYEIIPVRKDFATDIYINSVGGSGQRLGYGNSSLAQNTVFGKDALGFTTGTGNFNTAFGFKALNYTTTGSNNTVIGANAVRANQTGSGNTGIGQATMWNLDGSSNNTALGAQTFYNIVSGDNNIAIGQSAASLFGSAGNNLTSASNGIYIGTNSRAGVNSPTNEVVIGNASLGNGSNTVTIGNASTTSNYFKGDINLTGNVNGGTWSGTTIGSNYGGAGTINGLLKANGSGVVSAAVAGTDFMAANATTTLTGDVTGSGNGSFATTLANSGVTSGTYGSSTTIPVLTVDSKGRVTSAGTMGIVAGVNSLNYTSTTSYADGGTISGTTLTLTAADGTNPGLISTGAQTIAGAKTFSNDVTAPNFIGNVTGTVTGNLSGTANTATNFAGGVSGSIPYQTAPGTTGFIPNGAANQFLTSTGSGTYTWTSAAGVTGNFVPYTGATQAVNLGAYDLKVNGLTVGTGVNGSTISNTAFGVGALAGNNSGTGKNTAIGYSALNKNTSGYGNTAVGYNTSLNQTNSLGNTAIGSTALEKNIANGNTAVGNGAGVGLDDNTFYYNSFLGYGAGGKARGAYNVGVGYLALEMRNSGTNIGADRNVAIGNNAMALSSKPIANVVIGDYAGYNISNGSYNVIFGQQSGYNLSAGYHNTILGDSTGLGITTGSRNTIIGAKVTGLSPTLTGNIIFADGAGNIRAQHDGTSWNLGVIGAGTWSGTVIGSNYGGAGSTNGLLKANGTGVVSAAISGTDYLVPNATITAATKTKITYDAKGLVTAGADATTADIAPSTNRNYVTDAQAGVLSNTSGVNTGDQTITLTGDVTGTGTGTFTSTLANTGVTANTYGSSTLVPVLTVDAKGRITSASTTAINGGVNTITAIAASSSVNGATISGTELTLTPADASNPGLISIGNQTIAGIKTFVNAMTVSPTATSSSNGASTTIAAQSATSSLNSGGGLILNSGSGGSSANAGNINLNAGSAGFYGGSISLNAGAGGTNGGNITLTPGSGTTSGIVQINGQIKITGGSPSNGKVLTSDAAGLATWVAPAGITSVGAISASATANGASITSGILNLAPADASNGGIVNTLAQTFAGTKTFNSDVKIRSITAGQGNNTLQWNTAFGVLSLATASSTGNNNSGFGYYALRANTDGVGNTALGDRALSNNTTGSENVAIGHLSLYNKATYNRNIAIGSYALYDVTGDDNIAIGNEAGINLGSAGTAGTALKNILIGSYSGGKVGASTTMNTTGRNSVLIGYDVRPAADNETNEIVIAGYNGTAGAVGLGSNTTLIGNSATTNTRIMGELDLPSTTTSTSTTSGALKVSGGAGIAGALNVGGTTKLTGAATISNTTASTSTATGALIVRGGVGVAGNVTIGGTLEIDGGSPGAGKVLISDANGLASWSNAAGSTVVTTNTSYAITLTEAYVFYTGAGSGAFTIPAAAAGNAGKEITIKNKTAFGITVTPASGTFYIDNANASAANVSIGIEASNNWIKLVSDGTQWNVIRALF